METEVFEPGHLNNPFKDPFFWGFVGRSEVVEW